MKRFVAEVTRLPNGSLIHQFTCVDNGGVNHAVTQTLLDLVSESSAKALSEVEALVVAAEQGKYHPANPDIPDWSVNEKYVWLRAPMAPAGHICISNEYSGDYSRDEGTPQHFTYHQFHEAVGHWRKFLDAVRERGGENFVGHPVEVEVE
jgi:hypothetical protein